MNKISLIIEREYLTRVRKKSFLIMSILGPILIMLVYAIPILVMFVGQDEKKIQVLDESGLFKGKFEDDNFSKVKFVYVDGILDSVKADFQAKQHFTGLLYIPKLDTENPQGIAFFSEEGISSVTEQTIERTIEKELRQINLRKQISRLSFLQGDLTDTQLDSAKSQVTAAIKKADTDIELKTISLADGEEKDSSTGASTIAGVIGGLMVYMFVFLYGSQVMMSVIDEKSNRVIEVLIQSVKPFELMMGKILGIALVALTQVAIWCVLGWVLSTASGLAIAAFMGGEEKVAAIVAEQQKQGIDQQMANAANVPEEAKKAVPDKMAVYQKMTDAVNTLNIPLLIGCFVFYFIFGYLMYSGLFGAVGAAVESQQDAQQFMMPVTVPLILGFALSPTIMQDPNGIFGQVLSIFPLTSPIIMMIRLPFIGFNWEVALSMAMLVLSFVGTTWVAGRIFRVGILMYGKKPTYKELGKWILSNR